MRTITPPININNRITPTRNQRNDAFETGFAVSALLEVEVGSCEGLCALFATRSPGPFVGVGRVTRELLGGFPFET
jgi:hypothetical protein